MKSLLPILAAALALGASTLSAESARKPNIVFILADDLGFGDLGCYGQKIIRTPNIDRMAAEGMKFTQHYSGNAVCAPSRCVLMTGKHPGHAFIRDNRSIQPEGQWPIPAEEITIAEALKGQGYTTGGFGKWGLGGPDTTGEPLKQGMDRFFGYNCQGVAHNFYPAYLWDNAKKIMLDNPPGNGHGTLEPGENPNDPKSYERFSGKQYSADLIAEQSLAFVKANKDQPFFCYVPTTVPHLALQVPEDSAQEYIGKFDDPPFAGSGKGGYYPNFHPRATYAAMITRMDREIGRMMDLVKELGLDEHTIFVFVSDNGPLNGNHEGLAGTDCAFFNSNCGLRNGKGSLYEGGIRSPGIVRWKGRIAPGSTTDRVTGFEDWMPTLLELSGAPSAAPKDIDGISFAPTLLGKTQPERPFLYREFPSYGGQQSIRVGDWKAVRQNLKPNAGKKKATAKSGEWTPGGEIVIPDASLGTIVGTGPISRSALTKKLWDYIKKNNLQDPKDKAIVNADEKLQGITGGKKQFSMFELSSFAAKHFAAGEGAAPGAIELYNLKADPTESRNVAEAHPDVVAKLSALMREQHTPSKDFAMPVLDAQGK